MAIGDDPNDPLDAAKRKTSGGFTLPAITDFSLPFWKRTRTMNTGDPLQDKMQGGTLPMLNPQNYRSQFQQQNPVGSFYNNAFSKVGYNRGNVNDIFGGQQQPQAPSPFRYVSPEDAKSQGLYWSGQQTGWQKYGGDGPDKDFSNINSPSQNTVHFLPPGFTATTGSTGVQGSNPNDIHFLPPGFTSVQGTTNPQNQQLQSQPQQQQPNQFSGLPSVLDMLRKNQGDFGY